MRKLQALGLLALGVAIGAGIVTFDARTDAQVRSIQSIEELNQRFEASHWMVVHVPDQAPNHFRFFRDRQTGDCYVTHKSANLQSGVLTKTDDNACSGF